MIKIVLEFSTSARSILIRPDSDAAHSSLGGVSPAIPEAPKRGYLVDRKNIDKCPIGRLKPYDRNPRKNDAAVDAVVLSIKEFGFVSPIIVDSDYRVCAGHTRLKAAKKLGLKYVPVVMVASLTGQKFTGYNIADNQTGSIAEWDDKELAQIIQDLQAEDFDVSGLGFDAEEFNRIMAALDEEPEYLKDPDWSPNADDVPTRTKPGDLWLLGDHRVLCGDATDSIAVEQLMQTKKATLFATDPPYGVAYGVQTSHGSQIANDEDDGPKLQSFLESVFSAALPHLQENAAWYLWHAQMTQGYFAAAAAAAAGVIVHRQIVWVKPSLILGHGDYHWRHELCFYGWVKGHRPNWYGDRKQTTVWEIERERDGIHPTQKPVELFRRPMQFNTKSKEICYDPFLGSGTTMIAAEQLGRKCYGMEIEPKYVDVAVKRWEEFTGREAVLSNG